MIAGLEVEMAEPLRRFEAEYLWMHVLEEQSELECSRHEMGRTECGYSTVALTLDYWQL